MFAYDLYHDYANSAFAQVQWALNFQKENGWFDKCCLSDLSSLSTPASDCLLGDILEAYRFSNEIRYRDGAYTANL